MTPLSNALRRLADGPPPTRPAIVAPEPTAPEAIVEATAAEPLQQGPTLEPATLPQPEGDLRLYFALPGEGESAWRAAAPSCGLVVHLAPVEARAENAEVDQAESLLAVRWPAGASPRTLTTSAEAKRVRLVTAGVPFVARDWILFLDDCRAKYTAVGLVATADAQTPVDPLTCWLAERCDDVHLVARSDAQDVERVRRVVGQLRRIAPRRPTCVLVDAA